MNRTIASLLFLACTAVAAETRVETPLDQNWRFSYGANEGAEAAGFKDENWQSVNLPHTWNHMGGTKERTPDYNHERGQGWYRLSFTPPADIKDKRLFLQFDAASIVTDVWLNGKKVGNHKGAFGRFRFDVSGLIEPGHANLLAVRTDNSHPSQPGAATAEVIPMSGDFFMFGGLYRKVSLIATNQAHLDMLDDGGPGIYARTRAIEGAKATIDVDERLKNDGAAARSLTVKTSLLDRDGREAASAAQAVTLQPGETSVIRPQLTLKNPHLWNGKQDPYLYRLVATLASEQGEPLDQLSQNFGVRTYRFDADKGFFLNGKSLPLQGVARHQDRPAKGWAINEDDMKEDMGIMLELGINTLRLAHYQHDQAIYNLADQAGLAVWAEIPVVDRTAPYGTDDTTPGFIANAESQLRELIKQNYNHASVLMWSIGNEVNLAAQKNEHPMSHAFPLLEPLNALAHQLDSSRPTTMADCCEPWPEKMQGSRTEVTAGITDLYGYNRYQGWYYQTAQDLGPVLDRLHSLHPTLPIAVTEYGGGGALTQHSDDGLGGVVYPTGHFHPEEHQASLHEIWWAQLKKRPYLWGTYIWNMFDFVSDIRYEGDLVDTNDKGLVSNDRKIRKDVFYLYQAEWTSKPMVHVNGRRYVDRAYPVTDVKVYSNQAKVKLSLNGRDLGAAACPDHICVWKDVRLNQGDNQVTASANGASDSLTWRYDGKPNVIRIRAGNAAGVTLVDGDRFGSDAFFEGGEAHDRHPAPTKTTLFPEIPAIGEPGKTPLYENWREGKFAYHLPLQPGRYKVKLRFMAPDAKPHRFEVLANGKKMVKPFDMATVEKDFEVSVEKKGLTLDFHPIEGSAVVSAIEAQPF